MAKRKHQPPSPRPDGLAQLVRSSPVLDANLKRYWLSVLDHLSPADRERLREILTTDSPEPAGTLRPTL